MARIEDDYDTVKFNLNTDIVKEFNNISVEEVPKFRDVGAYSYPHNAIAFLAGMTLLVATYISIWFLQ